MDNILDKIRKIEALIAGATSEGEKNAAIAARLRIINRYPLLESSKDQKEFALYTQDNWHKKLLLALCRKYGVKPYRYNRQKFTTVMIKTDKQFLNEVLWKEYLEYSKHLEHLMEEIADGIIAKIHLSEKEEII